MNSNDMNISKITYIENRLIAVVNRLLAGCSKYPNNKAKYLLLLSQLVTRLEERFNNYGPSNFYYVLDGILIELRNCEYECNIRNNYSMQLKLLNLTTLPDDMLNFTYTTINAVCDIIERYKDYCDSK
jgi:hypothetical protein